MASSTGGGNSRGNTAKAMVSDQISQAVLSTSNLLHLMQQSCPSQAQLIKPLKNLLLKTSTIKNTGQLLEQMPLVISSLDAHMENGSQRLYTKPHCSSSAKSSYSQTWKAANLVPSLKLMSFKRKESSKKTRGKRKKIGHDLDREAPIVDRTIWISGYDYLLRRIRIENLDPLATHKKGVKVALQSTTTYLYDYDLQARLVSDAVS